VVVEVVPKDIFERLGSPMQVEDYMELAELEKLQKREVNLQPSAHLPAFVLDMLEEETDKVCESSAMQILNQEYSAPVQQHCHFLSLIEANF